MRLNRVQVLASALLLGACYRQQAMDVANDAPRPMDLPAVLACDWTAGAPIVLAEGSNGECWVAGAVHADRDEALVAWNGPCDSGPEGTHLALVTLADPPEIVARSQLVALVRDIASRGDGWAILTDGSVELLDRELGITETVPTPTTAGHFNGVDPDVVVGQRGTDWIAWSLEARVEIDAPFPSFSRVEWIPHQGWIGAGLGFLERQPTGHALQRIDLPERDDGIADLAADPLTPGVVVRRMFVHGMIATLDRVGFRDPMTAPITELALPNAIPASNLVTTDGEALFLGQEHTLWSAPLDGSNPTETVVPLESAGWSARLIARRTPALAAVIDVLEGSGYDSTVQVRPLLCAR
jgi:hypothetical protein